MRPMGRMGLMGAKTSAKKIPSQVGAAVLIVPSENLTLFK